MTDKFDDDLFEDEEYDGDLFEDEAYDEPAKPVYRGNTWSSPESTEEEDPDKMGKLQAATVSADPLFINPQIGGVAAMAGEAVGRPSGIEESADKAIAKTEKAIEKLSKKDLTKKSNLNRVQKLQANLSDLQKLKDPSYKDTYYEGQEDTKALEAKAFEDQPEAAVTGMLGGGMLSPFPGSLIKGAGKVGKVASKILPSTEGIGKVAAFGKRAKAAEKMGLESSRKLALIKKNKQAGKIALREGVKAGAMSGASRGDSKLFEGDVDGFIKDTLVGGAIGGTAGVVFDKGTRAIGNLLTNSGYARQLKTIFAKGTEGKTIDRDFVRDDLVDLSDKYIKEFQSRLKKTGANIGKIYKEMNEPGEMISTEEFVTRLRGIAKHSGENEKPVISRLLAVLDDYSLGGKNDNKIVEQLEKKILNKKIGSASAIQKAKIKQANKDLKHAIENKKPVSRDDLGTQSSKDWLPGDGPEVQAQVGHQIFEKKVPTGVEHVHKVSAEPIKGFKPSKIKQSVDPGTGRQYALSYDEASGEINRVIGEVKKEIVNELPAKDLHKLVVKLDKVNLSRIDTNTANEVREVTKAIRDKLTQSIKDPKTKQELLNSNKAYSALKDIESRVGLDVEDSVKVSQNIQKVILGIGDKGDHNAFKKFIIKVKEVDPKLAHEIQTEIADIRFRSGIANLKEDYVNTVSPQVKPGMMSTIMALLGRVPAAVNKGVNALGRSKHEFITAGKKAAKSGKNYLANRTLNLSQSSQDDIQAMIRGIEASKNKADKHFLGPLKKAAESNNHRSKQSIMYGLSQQPAFVETINNISADDAPEEE